MLCYYLSTNSESDTVYPNSPVNLRLYPPQIAIVFLCVLFFSFEVTLKIEKKLSVKVRFQGEHGRGGGGGGGVECI